MVTAKRNLHTYKAQDRHYLRAFKKAKRNGKALATLIEEFVIDYGQPVKKAKGGIPLPADYVSLEQIGIIDSKGKRHEFNTDKTQTS